MPQALEFLQETWNLLAGLPAFIKFAAGFLLTIWPLVKFSNHAAEWWQRQRTAKQVNNAQSIAGMPLRDPDAPHRILVPPTFKTLDHVSSAFFLIKHLVKREKFQFNQLTRANDLDEVYVDLAVFSSGDVRGVGDLPANIARGVHFFLAAKFLDAANAPRSAKERLEEKFGGAPQDLLVVSLFDRNIMKIVDLTPDVGDGDDYFTKYFQPVLISFGEQRFRESSAEWSSVEEVLVNHLKLLSGKRARAAWVTSETAPDDSKVTEILPQQVPKNFRMAEKAKAMKFNRNKAAKSIVLVADEDAVNRCMRLEKRIDDRLQSLGALADAQYSRWTPHLPPEFLPCVFLWQELREDAHPGP